MSFLYSLFIYLYILAIRIAALFNSKAKKTIVGRNSWALRLEQAIDSNEDWIWMHCSSLGEFEQGRPVFEAIKKQFPNHKLALSFFSPSGYEIRKDYDLADIVFYLPFDTPQNAKRLAKILQPTYWILVKYDFWFNHLKAQKNVGTKTIVISSIFRENQIYFKPLGRWLAKNLKTYITHFFVQNKSSKLLLHSIDINQVTVAGDTRFDRVKQIAANTQKLGWVEEFKNNKKLIVIGSSWFEDEQLWIAYMNKHELGDWKIILVPHEINPTQIQKLNDSLPIKTIRYSEIDLHKDLSNFKVLIVDAIGLLSKIYASADLAYVGGGFNKSGVHNTLEPAVFGVPIMIGPNYQKFDEVKRLKTEGIVFDIKNYAEFEQSLQDLMSHAQKRNEIALKAKRLFEHQNSATDIIMGYLTNK